MPTLVARRQTGAHEERQVPVAVDRKSKSDGGLGVQGVPTAEGDVTHAAPERARREGLTAAAQLVVAQAAVPQVNGLADAEDAGQLSERSFEQRGPAATLPAEVDDLERLGPGAVTGAADELADELTDAADAGGYVGAGGGGARRG